MNTVSIYKRHRFPAPIISHCVWLYYRFSLRFRDIELMMRKKGVIVSYESIRSWCLTFGLLFARQLRKRSFLDDCYHLDEVFCKINGHWVYVWRAVDQDGQTVDVLVQSKRDQAAALRFLKCVRKQGSSPRRIVTDKLRSYLLPCQDAFSCALHIRDKGANNRAEISHQATRLRECKMRKFKSVKQAQRFLSCFSRIYDHFRTFRHLCSAETFRSLMHKRLKEWRLITQGASEI